MIFGRASMRLVLAAPWAEVEILVLLSRQLSTMMGLSSQTLC